MLKVATFGAIGKLAVLNSIGFSCLSLLEGKHVKTKDENSPSLIVE